MNDVVVYDVAFSFAGEQRDYVERVVTACRALGIEVFYDRDHEVELWGRHSIIELRKAYGGARARYFVAFISAEYLSKRYPMDEFRAALLQSITKPDEYLLPVTFGDVEIPHELLDPAIFRLRSEEYPPERLAAAIQRRVAKVKAEQQPPEPVVKQPEQGRLRLPVTTPDDFSVYEELRRVLEYLGQQLQAAAQQLRTTGFIGTVERSDSEVKIRIERRGRIAYALDIRRGGGLFQDDATLNFVVGGRMSGVNSSNGWAKPYFDLDAGVAKLEMHDLSVFSSFSNSTTRYTKEEFFEALWNRIVDQLDEYRE